MSGLTEADLDALAEQHVGGSAWDESHDAAARAGYALGWERGRAAALEYAAAGLLRARAQGRAPREALPEVAEVQVGNIWHDAEDVRIAAQAIGMAAASPLRDVVEVPREEWEAATMVAQQIQEMADYQDLTEALVVGLRRECHRLRAELARVRRNHLRRMGSVAAERRAQAQRSLTIHRDYVRIDRVYSRMDRYARFCAAIRAALREARR